MLNLFNKKKHLPQYPGFSWLVKDIHSHILPGIDDGSPDVETSLQLLRSFQMQAFMNLSDPHIISDLYRNTPETINNALSILKKAVLQNGMQIELSAAAEYMLDDHFMELSEKRTLAYS